MSDLTRVKGMAGRKRRIALLNGPTVRDQPNSERVRWFRPTADTQTTAEEPRPGDEHGISESVATVTDAELEVTVRLALRSTHFPLRAVDVVVTAGRVILIGRIPSFYLKQVAQEAARRVPGVSGFENRLVVERNVAAPTQPDGASGDDRPGFNNRSQ